MKIVILFFAVFLLAEASLASDAQLGVLDLRTADLYDNVELLNGVWSFYPGELLTKEQIAERPSSDYLYFPQLWNDQVTEQGKALRGVGCGTYYLKVYLPKKRPQLAIYIKHVYSAGDLWVNGEWVQFGGQVGLDQEHTIPVWEPVVIELKDADSLEIVLRIANYEHHKGGGREPLLLGASNRLHDKLEIIQGLDLLLAGALIMAGLFFVGLYFFGHRALSAFYFSLFCLTFSYRMLGADDYVVRLLYPIPWNVSIRLEYLSLCVPPMLFALYTHYLFPFRFRVSPLIIHAVLSGLYAVVILATPPSFYTTFVDWYLVVLLVGIVMAGYIYVRAYHRHLDGARYALISSFVVLVVFSYQIFVYMGSIQEIIWVSFIGYLLFFFYQSLILFFLFTNSLKLAKEQAEHAARTKADFLSMMSHEIRTPMNAVIGLTNFLLEDNPKEEHVETLNTLRFSAKNLLVIINDILDFSKIEAQKIVFENASVDIREVLNRLNQIFRPVAIQKGLDFDMICDARIPPYLVCDSTRTSQILTNLISNALKFTEKGHVTVRLELVEREIGYVTVRAEVRDSGLGINKGQQKAIFESFTQASSSTTRKFGGTGLGLTITKRLLTLQGSDLFLESEEGIGSSFYFTVRYAIGDGADVIHTSPEGASHTGIDATILLVEDNEVNVVVATKFLHKWGARVIVAKNGAEALEKLSEEKLNLILMDLQMPVMDGYTAVREIRKKGIKLPVIALTASALLEDQQKIYEAGMDDFVLKPFEPDQLLAKIRYYI